MDGGLHRPGKECGLHPNRLLKHFPRLQGRASYRIGDQFKPLPKYDRNLNTGAPLGQTVEMAVAEQRIYHDAEHPSIVVLPVIPRDEVEKEDIF